MRIPSPRPSAFAPLLGAALLIGALVGSAAGQQPLGRPAAADTIRADLVFDEMQAQLELLLPAMRRLAMTLQDALPEAGAERRGRPDLDAVARRAARFTRAYFDALLAEGFTREEALHIVSGMDAPRRP